MNRILLVDDQPPHASHHRHLFGNAVDVCRNYVELMQAINVNEIWSAAFVDFDLSGASDEPQRSGLSALRVLKQLRPETRRIVYTTLSDNGRTLYAAAAYHWLQADVILDKSSDDQALRTAANINAPNPTPQAWQDKLASANLIDHMFAKDNWLALWRMWAYYNGSIKAAADHLPSGHTASSVRTFSTDATDAVTNFKAAFYGANPTTYTRLTSARATPLVAFADANSKFFNAPDLQEVLDLAKPWLRGDASHTSSPPGRRRLR